MNKETIYRQDVLDLAKKGVLISNGSYESVCKAINEIPSVNPQPCEDAISIQAVEDAIYDAASSMDLNYGQIVEYIDKLPSVNPTKTGHWINLGVQGEIDGQIVKGFTCSKCGAISVFRMTGGKIVNGDLCPNCGAKMSES